MHTLREGKAYSGCAPLSLRKINGLGICLRVKLSGQSYTIEARVSSAARRDKL